MSMSLFGPGLEFEVAYRTERLRAAAGLRPLAEVERSLARTEADPAAGGTRGATAPGAMPQHASAARGSLPGRWSPRRWSPRRWHLRGSGAWPTAR